MWTAYCRDWGRAPRRRTLATALLQFLSMDFATHPQRHPARILCGILGLLVLVANGRVHAQDSLTNGTAADRPNSTVESVVSAFERGDYDALLDLAHRRVEIMILGQGARYSPSQAKMVMRTFFRQHPPERVQLSEYAASGGDRAAVGEYLPQSGEAPLYLYVGLRSTRGDRWELASIRIERMSFH